MPFMGRHTARTDKTSRTLAVYIATFSMGAPRSPSQPRQTGLPSATHAEVAPQELATIGGWFGSSLDLLRGLEVIDLGPGEWLNECQGALAAA